MAVMAAGAGAGTGAGTGGYLRLEPSMALDIAAAMGAGGHGSPLAWWDGLSPGEQAMLIAWMRIRRGEEHERARGQQG